ncbi:25S rRNA (cytosine(2278)-C(5))-methyltransferase [Ceratocystis fimbriata CBS 114723]|uniref:25S rRNA (Cytosine(2278)-C(5))-methyltransferase n=1 Tax=Ceratocystis fimbriata CBS 114723 TaxID=1035309 RepID=A0A2C5XGD3_9PEZI|nr:25S rRNA (cytosine(2278)-C(5))-methyltransferase [Ceratocystis fimbriata CBS 114723]
MSLYYEAADVLRTLDTAPGSLKNRVFKRKDLKSSAAQVYALAIESCKWSGILREVIDATDLLKSERKITPVLALLLVHDLLLTKGGISLPASHGLRAAIERHKGRLASELTRARIRRKQPTLDALRQLVEQENKSEDAGYPRWIRVNTILSDVATELQTTFKGFTQVGSVAEVMAAAPGTAIHVDEHIPNLLAASPGTDVTKTEAYRTGRIIFQDKASCFPAYLLDPMPEHGDVIDGCAAPGNKTSHLAALLWDRRGEAQAANVKRSLVYAYEKSRQRSEILTKMIGIAGAKDIVRIAFGQDFLQTDPESMDFVSSLLLDPSCSGSGILGRDSNPTLYLPTPYEKPAPGPGKGAGAKLKPGATKDTVNVSSKKRKRPASDAQEAQAETADDPSAAAARVLLDDDGNPIFAASSAQELDARLRALASFQLKIVLHALSFPGARRITYSTCSVHAEENEGVVRAALASDVARRRGWRVLSREEQVRGLREWPVRGDKAAAGGDEKVAEACIRSYKGDGRGLMGFFVAGFIRDGDGCGAGAEAEPFVRDESGMIVRQPGTGMPLLKKTGEFVELLEGDELEATATEDSDDDSESESESESGSDDESRNGSGGVSASGDHSEDESSSNSDAGGSWAGFED